MTDPLPSPADVDIGSEPRGEGRRYWLRWPVYLSAAISLGCLVLALRDVQLGQAWEALTHVKAWELLLALASVGLTLVLKGLRWRLLLSVRSSPSLGRVISAQSIGMLVNAALPARLGDLVRAYLIGETESESKVFALGTIVLEKVIDLLFLALSLLLLLSFVVLPDWLPTREMVLALGLAVIAIWFVNWQSPLILRGARWLIGFAPARARDWLQRQTELALMSLQPVCRPLMLAGLLAWSVLIWGVSSLTNWLVWRAMDMTLPPWAALLLLVVLQAGMAVPSSPGRVGVFQYLTVLCLSLFPVTKELAFSYGVVLHLVTYVPVVGLGTYYLWREKITLLKLLEAARQVERRLRKAG